MAAMYLLHSCNPELSGFKQLPRLCLSRVSKIGTIEIQLCKKKLCMTLFEFHWEKSYRQMVSTWNLGRLAALGLVCNYGWSQLAANFDPGFWMIQKLDCFENTLKNPGFLWRISCSISHLATIICPKKIFFPILAHCAVFETNLTYLDLT